MATFRNAPPASHREHLRRYSLAEWIRTLPWLDASGIALYFLHRLKSLNICDEMPRHLLKQLEQRQVDNIDRNAALLEEFQRINGALQTAGVQYVNLKGFTLIPGYCPDVALRYQMDIDFLVARVDANRCHGILRALGYFAISADSHVVEFKTEPGRLPHVRNLYTTKPQRSVEIHLCDASGPEVNDHFLKKSGLFTVNGISYPSLSAEDMFLAHAFHIFRHLRSEWTRISWLMELTYFLKTQYANNTLWDGIRTRAAEIPGAAIAIAVTIKAAERAFGQFAPEKLTDWTAGELPVAINLWIERYGNEVLATNFPGSKLYLILEGELGKDSGTLRTIRRRLFPLNGPARVVEAPSDKFVQRLLAAYFQWKYRLHRLRFHTVQNLRYFLELRRWKRFLKQSVSYTGQSDVCRIANVHS